MKRILPTLKYSVFIVVIVLINVFVVNVTLVIGDSMSPTLNNLDIVLLYKFNYTPIIGDVVVTTAENELEVNLVKRVIATQGQQVVIKNGILTVDGNIVAEYISNDIELDIEIEVPDDAAFLIGDNYDCSKDSRHIGPITFMDIKGKVLFL